MDTTYDRALGRNLSIWTGGIIGSLILVFTQFFLRKITGFTKFNVGQFILWVLFDFACISVGIYAVFGEPHVPFLQEFREIVVYCVSLGIIPYLIACLFIAVSRLTREIRKGRWAPVKKYWFRDENEKIQLGLNPEQVLLLKSEDNYTSIYYLQNDKVEKKLIRNTLKNLEEQLEFPGLIRIHRSYMVNLQKIVSVKKAKRGFEVTVDQIPDLSLSVSETYKEEFKSLLRDE